MFCRRTRSCARANDANSVRGREHRRETTDPRGFAALCARAQIAQKVA